MSEAEVHIKPFPLIEKRESFSSKRAAVWLGRITNNALATQWLNRDYVSAYRSLEAPKLDAAGERVTRDLTRNGIAIARLDEFFPADWLERLRQAFAGYKEEYDRVHKASRKGKAAYIQTVHKEHTFIPGDFVSEYLAAPVFAAISAKYLEMVPRFVGNSFWHTYPAPVEERIYSQQWHRDYNDYKLVKIFLYLNDVEENGPFEYLVGSHGRGPLSRKFNVIGEDGYRAYAPNDEMEKLVADLPYFELSRVPEGERTGSAAPWDGKAARLLCTGPAGSLIVADTFGLHRGGYVRSGHRDLIMTTFSTNSNVHKPHFKVTPEFARGLSPFMRMVFGVD